MTEQLIGTEFEWSGMAWVVIEIRPGDRLMCRRKGCAPDPENEVVLMTELVECLVKTAIEFRRGPLRMAAK
jgi:hypothetical protein